MNAPIAPPRDTGPCTVIRIDDVRAAAYLAMRDDIAPFHQPRWGRAVESACGQRLHQLGAVAPDGAIIGFLPLHHVRSRLFGSALVSSAFGVSGGIVANDAHVARTLAAAAWSLASELGVGSVELRGGGNPGAPWSLDTDSYAGFAADLADSDEAQLLAIPRKQRAEIRKSLDAGLGVRIGRTARDRRDHYAVYAESVRNLGTPVFPRALFDAVLDAFGADADILTVHDGDAPVASVLSLYHGGAVMPYWGGGTRAARALRANERMYYALMLHARRRGCSRFDFGRSKRNTGAFAYKKNWGFDPAPLSYFHRSADDVARRSVNPLDPKYRFQVALWKRLPLAVANRIGPWLSRGLG